jgi:ParB-like chromosome segregation protein Spo0J
MKTVSVKLSDLSQDPANARKHDDRNIDSIVGSLRRFGQQKPIVIDMNNIVRAGNGTLEAAKRLGWDAIECVKTNLKGSDAVAYAIADNRTAELAEWDEDILAAQLNGLLTDDEALANAAGFLAEEIEAMLSQQLPDEKSQVDLCSKWEIVVTCESESDQQKVFDMLQKEGYKCRVLTF